MGRATTQRPAETPVPQPMAASPSQPVVQSAPPSAPTMMAQSPFQQGTAQPFAGGPSYTPAGQQAQMAMGTPGALAINQPQPGLAPQNNAPAKTVLGVQAPAGLGNYATGAVPPQQPSPYGYPQPGMPQQQAYGQGGWQPAQPQYSNYTGQQAPYGYGSQPMGALPVDQHSMAPMVEGKKSTLARDIGIGVGIAALVLVAFLVVKMFVLDKGSDGKDQPASTIATVHLKMTAGIAGRMFIDDKDSMTVEDGQDVPISAGKHKIRIVGPVNACDTIVALEGGKTTTLDCVLAPPSGSAAAPTGSTGSAGSAAVAQAGSAEVKAPEVKAPEVKTPEVKTPEVPETKGSASVKTPEVKTETIKTKTPETKTTTHKATETKTPEHTKTTETTKTETAADPSKGYLQVFSKPVAKILVDGVDTGMKTPISGHTLALTPGKHKVTFVIGDDRFTYPVTIKQGSTETMSKDLQ
jgi:hypothetical protein